MNRAKQLVAALLILALVAVLVPAAGITAFAANPIKVQLWDVEGVTSGTVVGTTTAASDKHDATGTISASGGYQDSQAYAYNLTSIVSGKANSEEVTIDFSQYGDFASTTVTATDQILWMYIDSGLSTDARIVFNVNGYNLRAYGASATIPSGSTYMPETDEDCYSIYTIVLNVETNQYQIVEVPYQINDADDETGDSDGVSGLSFLHYTSSATSANSNARIKVNAGWSGWVGVPLYAIYTNASKYIAVGDTLNTMKVALYRQNTYDAGSGNWTANESLYFDEFWLTDNGQMPGVIQNEAEEPDDAFRAQLWDLDESSAALTGQSISNNTDRNDAQLNRTAGVGLNGSNALEYKRTDIAYGYANSYMTETVQLANTTTLKNNGFDTTVKTKAEDDIFWFWMDSDMTQVMRLNFQINGSPINGGNTTSADTTVNTNTYVYTIRANASGKPEMVKLYHDLHDAVINGIGLSDVNSNNKGNYSVLKFEPGWAGWVGIPMNMLQTAVPADSSITKIALQLRISNGVDGYRHDQVANESIYLDEFWLTAAGTMPGLSDAELLAGATVKLEVAARYQSDMIFQHSAPWQIHGAAPAGKEVTVTLKNAAGDTVQTKNVTAAADNTFVAVMDAVAGSYEAYTVTVSCNGISKTLENVAFGEVWVAGGQSNMFYSITETNDTMFDANLDVTALQNALADAKHAGAIRMFYSIMPLADFDGEHSQTTGSWKTATDWNSVLDTSAVAMYYIEKLQTQLDMPVGVVVTARGGTGISTWVDADVAAGYSSFTSAATALKYHTTASAQFRLYGYFNSTVAPWAGYEAAGLLWYQGEQDRFNPEMQELGFEVMLDSFSKTFNSDSSDTAMLNTIAVQVAPFIGYINGNTYPDADLMTNFNLNAAMRKGVAKAQAKGAEVVLVPIYDLAAVVDDHHPLNKLDVATRLYQVAQETFYNSTSANVYSGPSVTGFTYTASDGYLLLTFDQAVKYIQLTAEDNERLVLKNSDEDTDNDYQLPDDEELYGDKLNGFAIWTGLGYVEAEAEVVGTNQVKIYVPEGVVPAGVTYARGLEVLSANLYDTDGLPALPFVYLTDLHVEHQTKLWDVEETDVQVIVEENASSGRNTSKISIVDGAGFTNSQALRYELVTTGNERTHTWNCYDLDTYGFNTNITVANDDDILWFYLKADLSTLQRLQFAINGQTILTDEESYFYTLTWDDDKNTVMQKIFLSETHNLDGISLKAHSATQAQLLLDRDWYGWVGIPVNMFPNGVADRTDTITSLGILLLQKPGEDARVTAQQEGDAVIFDEFWLTDKNSFPPLEDMIDLYTPVWDMEGNFIELSIDGTYEDTAETARNSSFTSEAEGYGVLGSVAMKFEALEDSAVSNTHTSNVDGTIIVESITNTVNLHWDNYGGRNMTVKADDDIFWFWMDAALTTNQRAVFQVEGMDVKISADRETYVYTIVKNAEGKPEMMKIPYSPDHNHPADTIFGVDLVNSAPYNSKGPFAQVRVSEDWSGWIGIPMNMLSNKEGETMTAGDTIMTFGFLLRQYTTDEAIEHQNTGDAVYLDEFWLTAADTMPGLSDEALLYVGSAQGTDIKEDVKTITSAPLWTFGGDKVDIPLSAGVNATMNLTHGYGQAGRLGLVVIATDDLSGESTMPLQVSTSNQQALYSKINTSELAHVFEFSYAYEGQNLEDEMLWFWVDGSGLTNNARLSLGACNVGGDTYYYTWNSQFTIDRSGNIQEQALGTNGDSQEGFVSGTAQGRITIEAGWSGWVGIPVTQMRTADGEQGLTSLGGLQISLCPGIDPETGAVTNLNAGECIGIGDIWLSKKDSEEADANWTVPEPAKIRFNAASLTIDNDISLNFKANAGMTNEGILSLPDFSDGAYHNPYAIFRLGGYTTKVPGEYDASTGRYVFRLLNILPAWMDEVAEAAIFAQGNDGVLYQSQIIYYSVGQYCKNILNRDFSDATERTALSGLLVDLLEYGAMAQRYTDPTIGDDALVTAPLSSVMKSWISTYEPECASDVAIGAAPESEQASWSSGALFLRETIRLRMRFNTTLTEDLTVRITDMSGNLICTVAQEKMYAVTGGYVFFFDELNVRQMRTPVQMTVYAGDTPVSRTLTYSIQTYAYNAITANEDIHLVNVMKAMLRYGDAAIEYIESLTSST